MDSPFHIIVNGRAREIACDPDRTLLDVLREDLRLTGTKCGCGIGVCGTCTVLVGGKAKRACRVKMQDMRRERQDTRHETRDSRPTSPRADLGLESRVSCLVSDVSSLPQITTIEGLERDGGLHPIQQAFIDCGAVQCGFCTPGMILQAKALLDENPSPTRDEIKKALAANLCRCTGYQQIFEAVEEAARRIAAQGER